MIAPTTIDNTDTPVQPLVARADRWHDVGWGTVCADLYAIEALAMVDPHDRLATLIRWD